MLACKDVLGWALVAVLMLISLALTLLTLLEHLYVAGSMGHDIFEFANPLQLRHWLNFFFLKRSRSALRFLITDDFDSCAWRPFLLRSAHEPQYTLL